VVDSFQRIQENHLENAVNDQSAVFMLAADEQTGRRFVVGQVERTGPHTLVAAFESPEGCPQPGEESMLYFKEGKCFLRQSWKVSSVLPADPGLRISFTGPTEPEPGDLRGSERIPTVMNGMTATLDGERDCLVFDISEAGIALTATRMHEIGSYLRFEMWARDTLYTGSVKVCNAAAQPRGRTRYGLQVVEDRDDDRLHRSIRRLWLALRLRQLESLTN
jgi:hypothetical protein